MPIYTFLSCRLLHCALAAAQCIVIGPVCLFVCGCVCLWDSVCFASERFFISEIFIDGNENGVDLDGRSGNGGRDSSLPYE